MQHSCPHPPLTLAPPKDLKTWMKGRHCPAWTGLKCRPVFLWTNTFGPPPTDEFGSQAPSNGPGCCLRSPGSGADVGHGGSRGVGCKCSHQQNFWQRDWVSQTQRLQGCFVHSPIQQGWIWPARLKSSPLTSTAGWPGAD